jgi:ApbE superfamily uncharacterized protein (UPF0280 family)
MQAQSPTREPQGPTATMLPDGRRLHLNHGPIDLIIEAFGADRHISYQQAAHRFQTVLEELVGELKLLREPCQPDRQFKGAIARRMQSAVQCFLPQFITPMAAVAGAVADEILDTMKMSEGLQRIYVNNGGDTAFYLANGEQIRAAIAAPFPANIVIHSSDKFRGIATSGWRGRSQSFGIADSASIVANNCASADAAATMIANSVDLPGHPAISRQPAFEISSDSDLGERLVTTDVGSLSDSEVDEALSRGEALACSYYSRGMIGGAMLVLRNQTRQIGGTNLIQTEQPALQKELLDGEFADG